MRARLLGVLPLAAYQAGRNFYLPVAANVITKGTTKYLLKQYPGCFSSLKREEIGEIDDYVTHALTLAREERKHAVARRRIARNTTFSLSFSCRPYLADGKYARGSRLNEVVAVQPDIKSVSGLANNSPSHRCFSPFFSSFFRDDTSLISPRASVRDDFEQPHDLIRPTQMEYYLLYYSASLFSTNIGWFVV